jgi:hypothetical protein
VIWVIKKEEGTMFSPTALIAAAAVTLILMPISVVLSELI